MTKVSKAAVARQVRVDCCHRCGGLMIPEQVHELGSFDWRCVSCGERVDPVILEHRREEVARAEADKSVAGHGNSRLS